MTSSSPAPKKEKIFIDTDTQKSVAQLFEASTTAAIDFYNVPSQMAYKAACWSKAHTEALCLDAASLQNVTRPQLNSLSTDVSLALATIGDFKKQRFGQIADGVLSDTTLKAIHEAWKKVSKEEKEMLANSHNNNNKKQHQQQQHQQVSDHDSNKAEIGSTKDDGTTSTRNSSNSQKTNNTNTNTNNNQTATPNKLDERTEENNAKKDVAKEDGKEKPIVVVEPPSLVSTEAGDDQAELVDDDKIHASVEHVDDQMELASPKFENVDDQKQKEDEVSPVVVGAEKKTDDEEENNTDGNVNNNNDNEEGDEEVEEIEEVEETSEE